jgi:hypothetical protein
MNQASKADGLLSLIHSGLQKHAEMTTSKMLGDRKTYIGMSDIGASLDCQRAIVMRKLFPDTGCELRKQIILQRGHWLEYGIAQALSANRLNFLSQPELSTVHQGVPVKAHPDFVLAWEKPYPAVRILEMKSTEKPPTTMYSSYEAQVYGQIGLLHKLWNSKSFDRRNETFPELCRRKFGISLPADPGQVSMEAWIVCISMNDAKTFGPYQPDADMLNLCLSTAATLWTMLRRCRKDSAALNELEYASGPHPLCSRCSFNADCPKFSGEYHPEWEETLQRLSDLKIRRDSVEQEISEIEDMLKNVCAASPSDGWISTDKHRFRTTRQTRRSLDKNLLRQQLAFFKGTDPDGFISRCETESQSYSRLYVNKIN